MRVKADSGPFLRSGGRITEEKEASERKGNFSFKIAVYLFIPERNN